MIGIQYLNLALSKRDYALIRGVRDLRDLMVLPLEQQVLAFIENHWSKYGQMPDKATVIRHFPDFDNFDVAESPEALLHDMREHHLSVELKPVLEKSAALYADDSMRAVKYLQNEIVRLAKLLHSDISMYDYTRDIEGRIADYKIRASLDGMVGVPTGFPSLDADTLGWWNGHLNIIGGRTNEGKTWVGLYHSVIAWMNGRKTAIWSLESSKEEIAFRLDTLIAKIPNMALFSGRLTQEEYEKWIAFLESLKERQPLYILTNKDNGGKRWTADQIASVIEDQGMDFAMIDQASLMDDGKGKRTIRERFVEIATDCKTNAEGTNTPWMLLVQVNRDGAKAKADETPGLEQIAEADALGQFADRATIIRQIPPLMKMTLRKNRFGPKDQDYMLRWDVNTGMIEEMGQLQGVDVF